MEKPLLSTEEFIHFSSKEDLNKQIEYLSNILFLNQRKKDTREDKKSLENFYKSLSSPPKKKKKGNNYKNYLDSLLQKGQKEEIIEFLKKHASFEIENLNQKRKRSGYAPITIKKYNYMRSKKYQGIFKEIIREAREKKYYFIQLTITLSSSFHNFKKGKDKNLPFILNSQRNKDLTYTKEIDILQKFEKELLDYMRKKGKRIPNIKYISVLEMHASLDFHSHLIFMIPPSPQKGKKREYLDQFHKSFKNVKEKMKGEIGKTSKKDLPYKETVKTEYLLKSINFYQKKEKEAIRWAMFTILRSKMIRNSYLRDIPLTYFNRIHYFHFFYKKIMPLYKGKTFIEVIKTHFIIQKREIQIYQKYTYSTLSLKEKKEVLKEEIIYAPKDTSQVLYMASFDQIKIFLEGSYKDLEKFNLLYKEKLSIFPIGEKEESLKKFKAIELE